MNKTVTNINTVQLFAGLVALFLGFVVYIIRSPSRVYFLPECFSRLRFSHDIPNVIRIVANNLPDFIHAFAFVLITSALISSDNRRNQFLICLGWFALESFFEFGQHFKESYLRIIPSWFDNIPFLQNAKSFFLNGTFDVLDMLSILGGTVAAFWVLLITSKRRKEE